jgi:steroid 5-alpha reductase family enzyme
MTSLLLQGMLLMFIVMSVLWVIHLRLRNAAVVDVGWAAGLALLAIFYSFYGDGWALRRMLLAIVVGLWGFRLAIHLLMDRVWGKPEEGRYQEIRNRWKSNVPAKFFLFFQFQALLDVLLSVPFLLVAMNASTRFSFFEFAGLALWLIAFTGEAVADRQLKEFKKNSANRGAVCNAGLWKYSRHPNYFFEWLIWVAYTLIALSAPYGLVAIFAPVLMLYFLFKITGIPATEAQAVRTRGDAYREYQRSTSSFVPWFPKKANRAL